jgi:hypothetical protein
MVALESAESLSNSNRIARCVRACERDKPRLSLADKPAKSRASHQLANRALPRGLVAALANAAAAAAARGFEGFALGHAVAADAEFSEVAAIYAVVGDAEAVDAVEAALDAGAVADPSTAV